MSGGWRVLKIRRWKRLGRGGLGIRQRTGSALQVARVGSSSVGCNGFRGREFYWGMGRPRTPGRDGWGD